MPRPKKYSKNKKIYRKGSRATVSKNKALALKNARAIKKLNITQFRKCSYVVHHSQGPYDSAEPNDGSPIPAMQVSRIIAPSVWQPVFGSQPPPTANNLINKVSHPTSFLLSHINMKINVKLGGPNMGNDEMPIHFAFFVFNIKKEYREAVKLRASSQPITLSSTGDLKSLKEGQDYVYFDMGLGIPGVFAQWRMNPDIYNVVASRRGQISTWPADYPISATAFNGNYMFTPNGSLKDGNKNYNINIPWKRKLKCDVGYTESPPGQNPPTVIRKSWKSLNEVTTNDSDQLYTVLFHNAIHGEHSPLIFSQSHEFFGSEPQ